MYVVNWLRTLSATCHIVQQPVAIREGEKHRALKQTEMLNISGVIDAKQSVFPSNRFFKERALEPPRAKSVRREEKTSMPNLTLRFQHLAPCLFFDCSRALDYAKIWAVLWSGGALSKQTSPDKVLSIVVDMTMI